MSLLSGTGIAVRRGGVSVLAGVNFRLEEGEMVGLIGPNGAGKTTLLRALCGLQRREAGQIAILGDDLERLPRDHLARLLAYLPQGGGSQWGVAVETLVTLGRLPHRGPWRGPSPADAAAVESAMRACDVLQFAERSVSQLSGGELARVLLARALAGEPAILLADEPVAGLDPGHQIDVMAILRERTAARAGVAVVMHDLTLAARHCDRLVLLDRGGIE